jgi:hypothetical protein
MVAVPLFKDQKARAVHGDGETALQARGIEHFVADESAHTIGAQLGQRG